MQRLVGWILALGLAVSPAVARAGAGAAGEDSPATAKSDKTADPATTAPATSNTAAAKPAPANLESELDELRDLLESQAKQIQEQSEQLKQQQQQMQALQEQLKASSTTAVAPAPALAAAPATAPATTTVAAAMALPSSSSVPAASSPAPAAVAAAPQDQEKPSPLYFSIGSAHFTPSGFMDLTDFFRSKTIGSGIGTTFSSVPYQTSVPGAVLTENHMSAQNSRIALRVDSKVAGGDAVGYLETDFLGATNDNLYVTSNADALRLRLYFIDYRRNWFEFLAGQDWSMLTSNRNGIGFMPGDIFYSQDMDTNYQLGLVWERTPQVRFILHPSKSVAFGISVENSQQYIGSGVTVPASFSNAGNSPQVDTSQSYNNSGGPTTNALAVPNVAPDVVAKIAFDPKIGSSTAHFEVAGVETQFKINNGAAGGLNLGNTSRTGGGIAFNSNFQIFKNFRIFENAYWSSGGGREIGNANVPDFIIAPANNATGAPAAGSLYAISPVHSGSGIGGFEWQVVPKFMFYGYWGGVFISKDTALANNTFTACTTAASCVGFGQTGSGTNANKNEFEGTLGFIQYFWRSPNYGALSLITQASYLSRSPWNPSAALATTGSTGDPRFANLGMAYVDVRYTLP